MAEIRFKSSDVKTTIEGLTETYNSITTIIDKINEEKDLIPSYWSAKEATEFKNKVDEVSVMLGDFNTKYDGFLTLLNDIISVYEKANSDFIATINSLKNSEGEGSE